MKKQKYQQEELSVEVLSLVLENWDVITLIITNIAAIFIDSPKTRKLKKDKIL